MKGRTCVICEKNSNSVLYSDGAGSVSSNPVSKKKSAYNTIVIPVEGVKLSCNRRNRWGSTQLSKIPGILDISVGAG